MPSFGLEKVLSCGRSRGLLLEVGATNSPYVSLLVVNINFVVTLWVGGPLLIEQKETTRKHEEKNRRK